MKHDSDEQSIVRCIICGELLDGEESVRYVGAVAHASCASKSIEENVEGFDRRPFYIGSVGTFIALLMAIPMFTLIQDGGLYAVVFAGIAIGLVVQSVGFLGIRRTYFMPQGLILFVLALVTAAAYAVSSLSMALFWNNPDYFDGQGQLMIMTIPGMEFYLYIAYAMTGLLMIILAVVIFLLEGVINEGIQNRIIGIMCIVLVAFFVGSPVNIWIEFVFVSFIFLTAGPPRTWGEVSELEHHAN